MSRIRFIFFFSAPEKYKAPDNGESLEALSRRTKNFMEEQVEANESKYERVMIVAHAACNASIRAYIQRWGVERFWDGKYQKNCCVSKIVLNGHHYEMLDEARIYY